MKSLGTQQNELLDWALTDDLGREFLREIMNEFIQWEKEITKIC